MGGRLCLVEYFIQYPDAVWGRSVMEVGSGVGLTVLVVVELCRLICVSLLDCTDSCLTKLAHNVNVVNRDWKEIRGVVTGKGGALTTVRTPRGLSLCPFFLKYDAPCFSVSPAPRSAAKISFLYPLMRSHFEPPTNVFRF